MSADPTPPATNAPKNNAANGRESARQPTTRWLDTIGHTDKISAALI
jgi:hypothetical protein